MSGYDNVIPGFRASRDLVARVKALAAREAAVRGESRRNTSALVRRALVAYLEKHESAASVTTFAEKTAVKYE